MPINVENPLVIRQFLRLSIFLLGLMAVSSHADSVGGDFTLNTVDGKPFHLHDQQGKVVLLLFGYTHCPDVCPDTLARVRALTTRLGPAAGRMQTLFVSVDPARDTPEVLRQYVAYFGPNVTALTGSKTDIDRVVNQYHAQYRLLGSGDSYNVDHTAHLFVIDPAGKLARILPYGIPIDQLTEAVQELLKEPAAG